jgi:membrane protein involved in colicin uptake
MFRGREWAVAREVAMHREAAGERAAAADALRHAARHANANGARDEAAALLDDVHRLEENAPGVKGSFAAKDGTNAAGEGTNGRGHRKLQIVSEKLDEFWTGS